MTPTPGPYEQGKQNGEQEAWLEVIRKGHADIIAELRDMRRDHCVPRGERIAALGANVSRLWIALGGLFAALLMLGGWIIEAETARPRVSLSPKAKARAEAKP